MELWKMIFLFNWVIFRFQPFIFKGVPVNNSKSNITPTHSRTSLNKGQPVLQALPALQLLQLFFPGRFSLRLQHSTGILRLTSWRGFGGVYISLVEAN